MHVCANRRRLRPARWRQPRGPRVTPAESQRIRHWASPKEYGERRLASRVQWAWQYPLPRSTPPKYDARSMSSQTGRQGRRSASRNWWQRSACRTSTSHPTVGRGSVALPHAARPVRPCYVPCVGPAPAAPVPPTDLSTAVAPAPPVARASMPMAAPTALAVARAPATQEGRTSERMPAATASIRGKSAGGPGRGIRGAGQIANQRSASKCEGRASRAGRSPHTRGPCEQFSSTSSASAQFRGAMPALR